MNFVINLGFCSFDQSSTCLRVPNHLHHDDILPATVHWGKAIPKSKYNPWAIYEIIRPTKWIQLLNIIKYKIVRDALFKKKLLSKSLLILDRHFYFHLYWNGEWGPKCQNDCHQSPTPALNSFPEPSLSPH